MNRPSFLATLFTGALGFAALGCGTTKPPPAAAQEPAAAPAPAVALPANESAPAVAAPVAPGVKATAKAAPGKANTQPAMPSATPAPAAPPVKAGPATPMATPAPAVTASPTPAPAAAPAKAPAAPLASAHARVGPEKCMMCHRIQYTSWSESKHKAKGLDCEGCHGNGADYKTIAVMKDLAAAKKAGLILPDVAFCKKCHAKADAAFLMTAHAHKGK